jgi:integrase
LVAAFVQWQLQEGYAIGSINVRLSTVKKYVQLATQAGAVSPTEYALIKTVAGLRHAEGRNVDQARERTRKGTKKAQATAIGAGQALLLKDQADPRDTLLICILLDHGLRCGEIAALEVSAIDVAAGTLTFYRSKVHKTLGKAIGIERLSPHDCRHYFATAAVRGGTDIKALQEAGGWSSIAMPARYVQATAIANQGVKLG